MKNFVKHGDSLTITAPYDVLSGEVVIVNDLHGVAIIDAKKDDILTISTCGVYELEKADEEIMTGEKVFYDAQNKKVTKQSELIEGEVSIPLPCIGVFTSNADETKTTVEVKLV